MIGYSVSFLIDMIWLLIAPSSPTGNMAQALGRSYQLDGHLLKSAVVAYVAMVARSKWPSLSNHGKSPAVQDPRIMRAVRCTYFKRWMYSILGSTGLRARVEALSRRYGFDDMLVWAENSISA